MRLPCTPARVDALPAQWTALTPTHACVEVDDEEVAHRLFEVESLDDHTPSRRYLGGSEDSPSRTNV